MDKQLALTLWGNACWNIHGVDANGEVVDSLGVVGTAIIGAGGFTFIIYRG